MDNNKGIGNDDESEELRISEEHLNKVFTIMLFLLYLQIYFFTQSFKYIQLRTLLQQHSNESSLIVM
jgi:hypothetical protein